MNAEQKQRATELVAGWRGIYWRDNGNLMAALLQELVDAPEAEPFAVIHLDGSFVHVEFKQTVAGTGKFEVYAAPPVQSVPEPEPVAYATGYYAGCLSIATVDGRVLPAGTALYAAPPHQSEQHLEMVNTPAPSVPDGWIRAIDEAMVVHHIGIADRADSYEVAKKKLNELLAINSDIARDCSEAPADLARDAEPWKLLLENLVEGLNKTHWSSWQGTAHFDEYLQEAISAIERDKLKGQS